MSFKETFIVSTVSVRETAFSKGRILSSHSEQCKKFSKKLFPILGPSSLPVVGPGLTKDFVPQTEQLLCWSCMTDTEHCITSSSNEEKALIGKSRPYKKATLCLTIYNLANYSLSPVNSSS